MSRKSRFAFRRAALIVLCIVIVLCAVPLTALRLRHLTRCRKESALLQARGYQFAAADGGHALSYCKSGSETGEHIIIAIADTGENDYSVQLAPVAEYLGSSALIVSVDRAGCGLSGGSSQPQTAEQIVSDYRTALRNANIQPPYVLLPHSEGGLYAAYWQSRFPDEVEGVFFLSGTSPDMPEDDAQESAFSMQMKRLTAWLGLNRLAGEQPQLPADFRPAQRETARLLNLHSAVTAAQISERKLLAENRAAVSAALVPNDIPKAFLNTAAFGSAAEWLEADDFERSFIRKPALTEEERDICAAEAVRRGKQSAEALQPYLEQLGNCRYIELAGSRYIHMQKPMQCAVLLTQFLASLREQNIGSTA